MFVDVCFVMAYGVTKAKQLLGNFSAYTPTSAKEFKKMNSWFNYPEVGDVIFFENSERINHTGLVVDVSNTKVYTIEGNTSGGQAVIENGGEVCEKSYWLSNSRIAGYGRPDYDNPYDKPKETIHRSSSVNDIKWLQFQLNKVFKSLNVSIILKVDGDYGNKTVQAVLSLWEFLQWNKRKLDKGTRSGIKTIKKLDTF